MQISYIKPAEKGVIKVSSFQKKQIVKVASPPKPRFNPGNRFSGIKEKGSGIRMPSADIFKQDMSNEKQFAISKVKPSLESLGADDFVDLDKLSKLKTKPVFLNYYREIRERIRRYAILNYPANFAQGEVHLTFVIDSDGQLKELGIVDFKSIKDASLREAGLRSVKEAAPFASFPEGMKRDFVSFHIIISFELSR